jgi:hypothetical protein
MNVRPLFVGIEKYRQLMKSRAPRKIYLSEPGDRTIAATAIVNARVQARTLGIRGYDRHLLLAAVHAHLYGRVHVARMLSQAALD